MFLSLRDTCRAYAIRPYPTGRRYFYHACHQFFSRNPSFSCLDTRKGCEKKIKASGMPANLAGYPAFLLFVLCFLLSRVGAQKHTPHKTTRRGRSYLSMGGCFYPCGIHVGRMQYAPTLPTEKSRVCSWIFSMRPRPFRC